MASSPLSTNHIAITFLHLLLNRLASPDLPGFEGVSKANGGYTLNDTVALRGDQSIQWSPFSDQPESVTQSINHVRLEHQIHKQFSVVPAEMNRPMDQFSRAYLEQRADEMYRELRAVWPIGHKLVTADLALPPLQGSSAAVRADPRSGLSIRCLGQYDPVDDRFHYRFDILFGFTAPKKKVTPVQYVPTPAECEVIALLTEARDEWAKQLERLRAA